MVERSAPINTDGVGSRRRPRYEFVDAGKRGISLKSGFGGGQEKMGDGELGQS